MLTALEFYGHGEHRYLVEGIHNWLSRLPDNPNADGADKLWSCHGICRAVRDSFKLGSEWIVVDGHFMRAGQEHAWLINADRTLILDVLPVAALGGPLLVDAHSYGSPWPGAYLSAHYPKDRFYRFLEETELIMEVYAKHNRS